MTQVKPLILSAIAITIGTLNWIATSAAAQASLAQRAAESQSMVYTCPMHPEVRSERAGVCIKCGVPLVATSAPPELLNYELKLETTPALVKPGEKLQLRFLIFHPKSGEQVKQFKISYEKLFHLFVISQDLEYYDHIHPIQQQDGSFTIETELPKEGLYKIFCDFFPEGGTPQVIQQSVMTGHSHGGGHHATTTNLVADKSLVKVVDGIVFKLRLEPGEPVAGAPAILRYDLVNEKTGQPVKDLQPYLGAWGHTVTLSEDTTNFLHSHPTRLIPPAADLKKLVNRPQVAFHTFFPRPGNYRIWSQFQREDNVTTVSFTVHASRLDRIAKWDGNRWSAMADTAINGLNGAVRALAVNGKDVYVGGDFTTVNGVSANRIAKWDGRNWTTLGSGLDGTVWAMTIVGKDLYVGGDFSMAGGVSANRMAKWDGHHWSPLGLGISGCKDPFCVPAVYALGSSGSSIYVGGRFAKAGAVSANGIAKWDGNTWSPLGDGVSTGIYDGVVKALAENGKDLYVGGQFIRAGGIDSYNIAKWNGQSWEALSGGIRGNLEEVLAIGVSGSEVYVGGTFLTAGSENAVNIAKWNGSNWSRVDLQTRDEVRKILVNGNTIYIGGGRLQLASGVATNGIVKLEGGKWSGLGTGVGSDTHSGPIMAIALSDGDIYIGGAPFVIPEGQ